MVSFGKKISIIKQMEKIFLATKFSDYYKTFGLSQGNNKIRFYNLTAECSVFSIGTVVMSKLKLKLTAFPNGTTN